MHFTNNITVFILWKIYSSYMHTQYSLLQREKFYFIDAKFIVRSFCVILPVFAFLFCFKFVIPLLKVINYCLFEQVLRGFQLNYYSPD